MAQHPKTSKARSRIAAAGKESRKIARTLAHGTLLAAGIAVTHMSLPETDPRFSLFNRNLVDRLQAPITRHHE